MSLQHTLLSWPTDADDCSKEFLALTRRAQGQLNQIHAQVQAGTMPNIALASSNDEITAITDVATAIREQFARLVVLGTGGSSLGANAIISMHQHAFVPRGCEVLFVDNVDPDILDAMTQTLDLERTAFLIVSKSGGTAETLTQALCVIGAFTAQGKQAQIARQCWAVCVPDANPLRRLATRYCMTILDHDPQVGGRFSVFSKVGLLPAMVGGCDVHALIAGAWDVARPALSAEHDSLAQGAAWLVLGAQYEKNISVMIPYSDRLRQFCGWYRQTWAESVGKDGKGTTPFAATGTVDQHSQLQLFLGGPKDKHYTFITAPRHNHGPFLDPTLCDDPELSYLMGHTLGDVMEAEQKATMETLLRAGQPVRHIEIAQVDAYHLGALLMHVMLETIVSAMLWNVNPFDQPAVEEGKILARESLGR